MFSAVQDEWVISTVEASQGQRTLKDYGPLHATMQWPVGMEAPITRGMPYVTVVYSGATPKLSTMASGSNFAIDLALRIDFKDFLTFYYVD